MTTYFDKIKKDNKWFIDTIIGLIKDNTKEYGFEDLSSKNQNEMLKWCLDIGFINTSNKDFDFWVHSTEKIKEKFMLFILTKKIISIVNSFLNS